MDDDPRHRNVLPSRAGRIAIIFAQQYAEFSGWDDGTIPVDAVRGRQHPLRLNQGAATSEAAVPQQHGLPYPRSRLGDAAADDCGCNRVFRSV